MKRNFFVRILAMLSLFFAMFLYIHNSEIVVQAANYSGTCGYERTEDMTWELDSVTGILNIQGTGRMRDFDMDSQEAWRVAKSKVKIIVVGDGVTSLGTFAFFNCVNMIGIILPDSMVTISDYAFKNCKKLVDIHIPEGVTYIGNYAFGDCRAMTFIEIPESITTLSKGMFKDCVVLESIELPDSIRRVEEEAFFRCDSLKAVDFKEGVEFIGHLAFNECLSLQRVKLPSTVSVMESGAFRMCTSLQAVEIPSGVSTLASKLFYQCTNLRYVFLPYTITSIKNYVFDGCTNVTMVGMTNYLKQWAETNKVKFRQNGNVYCGLVYTIHNNQAVIVNYEGNPTTVYIPETINGYPVTTIWVRAFINCYSIVQVRVPAGVTAIEKYAFQNCEDLLEVTNYSSLEISKGSSDYGSIGLYAQNIRKSENEESIITTDRNGLMFAHFNNHHYLVGYIGDDESIQLPEKIQYNGEWLNYSIYQYAFTGATSLKECKLGRGAVYIANKAFYGCEELTNVFIPDTVTKIASGAFKECSSELFLSGYGGTYAEDYAWANEYDYQVLEKPVFNLNDAKISLEYTKTLYDGTKKCPKVTIEYDHEILAEGKDYNLEYRNSNLAGTALVVITGQGGYSGTLEKSYQIQLVTGQIYPVGELLYQITAQDSAGKLGRVSVVGVTNPKLIDITIGSSVRIGGQKFMITQISSEAFIDNVKLEAVTIGSKITKIGNKAFYGCRMLTEINIQSSKIQSFGKNTFKKVPAYATITIPEVKADEYQKLWSSVNTGMHQDIEIQTE